ncbi:MAG: hypothetical protein ACE5HO_19095, partial [bacterium]
VYFNLEPDRPTHFLFGKRSGFAKYGLKAGIEDFIPEHALRRNSAVNTNGIVPGFMLQLMYYRELMGVSQFFLNRFRDLESIWSNARASGSFSPSYNVLSGFLNHYRNLDSDKAKMKYLAVDKTNTLEGLMARDLFYRKYRYLENNATPSLFIIATAKKQSNSEVKYVNYFRKARRSRFKDRYFLISYDQDWQEIRRLQDLPAMRSNKTSIFDVTQNDQARNFCLIAEEIVVNDRKVKIESADMSDTVKVSAIGKRLLQELVPLSQDTTRFEVSDLLVGLSKTKRIDSTYQYPFPVIPVQPFKRTKALKVYLELYHLAADANNKRRFRINSEIKRIKKKGKAKGKKEKLVRCFNFTANKKSLVEILSFDVSHLVPGDYCIRFEVQDLNALQSRARETRFTLVK